MGNKKIYQARAEVAKALSHPLRLEIVDILSQREECCVSELEKVLNDASQSVISRHLKVLKEAGVISARKDGLNNYYFLNVPCIREFFTCLDQVLESELASRQNQLT
ncbi:MAG: ArsR/SmtB family transcription factor [Bacillota bacterium]